MMGVQDDSSGSDSYDTDTSSSSGSGSGSGSDSYDSNSSSSSSGDESSDSSDSETSSDEDDFDSDSEQGHVVRILKDKGLKKYVSAFRKIKTIKAAKQLDDKALRKLGIKSSSDRQSILHSFRLNKDLDSSSDSESSSADEYSTEDEEEEINQVLRQISLKKYIPNLKRGKIDTLEKAYKLDEKKLRKLQISLPSQRRRILAALKRRKESKEPDENDETKIARILRGIEMEKHQKILQRCKVFDMEAAYKLDVGKLKRGGLDSSSDRKKIIRAFKKYKETHEDDVDIGASVIQKLVYKAGMKKHYPSFKKKEIDTIAKAKKLEHKDLREMGINLYRERRDILDSFEKYRGGEISSDSLSASGIETTTNPVHDVLRSLFMSRHIADFDKAGIKTIREARALDQTRLRSMGVPLYLQREKVIQGFIDHKTKSKEILRVLIDANLARHAQEFEKLINIEDAKNLTHADLRTMVNTHS